MKLIMQRYIFFKTLKLSIFFLISIFLLFVVIDFSYHGSKLFVSSKGSFFSIFQYYLNNFFVNLKIFLPLTFMLSMIKTLSDMNVHNELIALKTSGVTSFQIFFPFLILAILFSSISYVNLEKFYPNALIFKDTFKEKHLKTHNKNKKASLPNVIYLDNSSRLIYQKYNSEKKELFDVFLIKSSSDVWHIKYLDTSIFPMKGKYVDKFIKEKNKFIKKESFDEHIFDDITFDMEEINQIFMPYETKSISALFKHKFYKKIPFNKEKAEISTQFYNKLFSPLIFLIIAISIFPSLLRFSRNISIFFIIFFSIFGFVLFYTLVDSATILSENSVLTPFICTSFPFAITFIIFFRKFLKIV
jgi:lipopolysaccharide export system permease protein